jgi:glycosyltransferase involved in cell wall biosynthesis
VRLNVHHFGPDPTTVGGMASVIRLCSEHNIGGDSVSAHPTWRPQSSLANVALWARAGAKLLGTPSVDVAHVHLSERGSFLREGSLVALAHKRGLTTVVTIHGASFMSFASRRRRLVGSVLKHADLIICLDQEVLELVQLLAPQTHSEILANPVAITGEVPPVDSTDELVVFAGEIGLRKGADVVARAWPLVAQRRPRARCLMVGPVLNFVPPATERLEVRPPIGPIEMQELLRSARVIALPARAEGMPMVLAEAMSLGRPFVSTPVGGIPELAEGGGVIVPVDDERLLADRLTDFLADPDLARTVGERGRQFCIETRSVQVIDARLRALYSDAAAHRNSARLG